jgi:hypothetical protein
MPVSSSNHENSAFYYLFIGIQNPSCVKKVRVVAAGNAVRLAAEP